MKTVITIQAIRNFCLLALTCLFINLQGQVQFRQYEITTQFTHGYDIFVEDINGDGYKDLVAVAGINGGEVAWWENDGEQHFGAKQIIRQNFLGARSVRAVDLDGDGDIDIIAAAWQANQILWWENDGNQNWTERTVDANFIGAHTVDIKDMNDDGYLDVLCSGFDYYGKEGEIAWWKNDGNQNFTKMLISERFQQSPFIYGEDMDGDEDLDIIACGELNEELLWWENTGNDEFIEHMIDDTFDGAHTVLARDVDGDNDMDILGAACLGSRMVWWENVGYNDFEKHDLGVFGGALWLDAADVDMDGEMDLIGGGMNMSRVAVWYNDGESNFTRYFLSGIFQSLFCVRPVDLDQDSDIDIVGIGYNSNLIAWEMNQTFNPDYIDAPESVAFDHAHSQYLVSCANADAIISMEKDTYAQSIWKENIQSPLGNCIHDGVFYVSSGTTLKGFDLENRGEVLSLNIPCLQHLDGMTCDENGNLYVIDTGGKIHRVNLSDGTSECIVNSGLTQNVQDCIYDPANNRLLTVGWVASAPIQAIDLETFEITTVTTTSFGYFDGITIDPLGNVYVASHQSPGKIIRYDADFTAYEIISTGHDEPAGLDYNSYDNILVVPNFGGSTLDFIPIQTIGFEDLDKGEENPIKIYPNPNNGKFMLKLEIPLGHGSWFSLVNSAGQQVLREELSETKSATLYPFNLEGSPKGLYILDLKNDDTVYSEKIVIR